MSIARLPKTVEYAIKILVCLALAAGRPVPAALAARQLRIPASQASKTLNYLRLRGLTRSRRGANGGYELRMRPEEIRVQWVIDLFQPAPERIPPSEPDPVLQVLSETAARFLREVGGMTIAELAQRAEVKGQLSP